MKYAKAGSEIKSWFQGMLANAPKDCLCHGRAQIMDIMGTPWCRDNEKYIVGWLENECDQRKLFEDEDLRNRMARYVSRMLRRRFKALRYAPRVAVWLGMKAVTSKGRSRRILLKRFLRVAIARAERKAR